MTTEVSITEYVYFIDELIPGLMSSAAQRRAGHTCRNKAGIKIIKCPLCGERLTDVAVSTKVELYRNPEKTRLHCHSYLKCKICKSEVGLMLKAS
jgi:hypothetical protein